MATQHQAIRPGSSVFGSQGGFVGIVQAAGESVIHVLGPTPDRTAYVIPVRNVARALRPGQFVLDCTIAELQSRGWERTPAGVTRQSLHLGSFVYAKHGGYVGVVEATAADVARVRGPGPDTPVYYVPMDAFVGQMAGGRELFLGCSVEELRSKGWLAPPHGQSRD
jgi:hypothetical protein